MISRIAGKIRKKLGRSVGEKFIEKNNIFGGNSISTGSWLFFHTKSVSLLFFLVILGSVLINLVSPYTVKLGSSVNKRRSDF